MNAWRLRSRDESGVSMVEFALILIPLVLILVGTMTFARAWNVHNTLDHAAREGARYGATLDDWDAAAVQDHMNAWLVSAGIDVSDMGSDPFCIRLVPRDDPCFGDGLSGVQRVQVEVEYSSYRIDLVMLPSPTVDMVGSAVSRYEGPPE